MGWRTIPGYEGYLEVNEDGEIRTVDRWVERPLKGKYIKKSTIKAQHEDDHGYMRIHAHFRGLDIGLLVHRAVAMAFIPNPENKPQVDHIDGNKKNNHVSNLRWATNRENFDYSVENGLRNNSFKTLKEYGQLPEVREKNISATKAKNSKRTLCFDITGKLIAEFNSATEASVQLNIPLSNIIKVCNGKKQSHKNYVFKYANTV